MDLPVGTLVYYPADGSSCSPICSGHFFIIVGWDIDYQYPNNTLAHLWWLPDDEHGGGTNVTESLSQEKLNLRMKYCKVVSPTWKQMEYP
jgi:hypothetical protein